MPGSSTSSTLMLFLLLLVLCTSFHLSSTCEGLRDLNSTLKNLGESVKDCSEDCSIAHVTDTKCKCLNLNMSQEEYVFPGYFIKALKSTQLANTSGDLVLVLDLINRHCNISFSSLYIKYEPIISPKTLYVQLNRVKEQIYTISGGN